MDTEERTANVDTVTKAVIVTGRVSAEEQDEEEEEEASSNGNCSSHSSPTSCHRHQRIRMRCIRKTARCSESAGST